ncbi:GDP-mannose 4,6-dehydratase [soil metagenome]
MKAIIFGSGGQDGFYLRRLLERENIETIGFSRSGGEVIGDVSDRDAVDRVIARERPDYVFHLAANSTTRHGALFDNHAAISTGTVNILESVYRLGAGTKVFLSGSAMQFENKGVPIDENTPFAPLSPYAVNRIHSVYAGRYFRSLSVNVYVGYFFNHDSPLRKPHHVNQKIAIAARSGDRIELGDIDVRKEFTYAGDAMEAVWRLVNQNVVHEAVIGSGLAHSIEEWLDLCYKCVGLNWRDYVTIKDNFEAEYRILVSNPALIKSIGWDPGIDIEGLAELMIKG